MNINQRQNILNWIETLQKIDVLDAISKQFPKEADANKIEFGNYRAPEFVIQYQRMLDQLKEELLNGLGLFLPASYNYPNDFGNVNLENDLSNIQNWINQKNFAQVALMVDKLIYYQISHGFWNKPISKPEGTKTDSKKILGEQENIGGARSNIC
ncbi:hypothetical protein [Xanthocytophaga flava]|uniref:hypothetical protein n=1 Tax=Xanthocytophaga flava TaxID=3048013 RepID=UPI0028D74D0C|nr:hypothetical protein [Xanthocytophaga flavus]MDJ1472440.1 hypothetical protein [Xanthocytophaga flavus]